MPLVAGTTTTPGSLAKAIKDQVSSRNTDFKDSVGDNMDWLFEAIAEAVVDHLKGNLLVTGTTASSCTTGGAVGTFTSQNVS